MSQTYGASVAKSHLSPAPCSATATELARCFPRQCLEPLPMPQTPSYCLAGGQSLVLINNLRIVSHSGART
eukprot:2884129-Rhodomonas_salina.1